MSFRARLALVATAAVALAVVLASVVRLRRRPRPAPRHRRRCAEGSRSGDLRASRCARSSQAIRLFLERGPGLGEAPGYIQVVTIDGDTIRAPEARVALPVSDHVLAVARGEQRLVLRRLPGVGRPRQGADDPGAGRSRASPSRSRARSPRWTPPSGASDSSSSSSRSPESRSPPCSVSSWRAPPSPRCVA